MTAVGIDTARIHAGALVWAETGLLIRGASGVGKTTLARAFVAEGARSGLFCRIVADDVTVLHPRAGRLVARPHARAAGLVERRALGILPADHEPACVIHLVIDLVDAPPRLPEPTDLQATLLGTMLPRIRVPRDAPTFDNVYLALDFLAALRACSCQIA